MAVAGVSVAPVPRRRWRPSLQRYSNQPLLGSDVCILRQQVKLTLNPAYESVTVLEVSLWDQQVYRRSFRSLVPLGLAAIHPDTRCASGRRRRLSPQSRWWFTGSLRDRVAATIWLYWSCPVPKVTVWPLTLTRMQHVCLLQTHYLGEILHHLVLSWLLPAGRDQVSISFPFSVTSEMIWSVACY